jgi:hypothetical protein
VPDTIPLARYLADAGLTEAEIASAMGIGRGEVARLPELAEVTIGATHVARLERSLYEAALPGETWSEKATPAGDVVRLSAYRAPDVSAAKALLAANAPRKYGDAPSAAVTHQTVIMQVASDHAAVASLRQLLGLERPVIEAERVPPAGVGASGD